jgi:hypothetical protein
MHETAICRWSDRLEDEPLKQAVQDRHRPGRPPKLADADRKEFRATVRNPPSEAGYDESA